jgi:hypothetical protein
LSKTLAAGESATIALSASPGLSVPSSVTVSGSNQATFPVTITRPAVAEDDYLMVTGVYDGRAESSVVTVQAPWPTTITFSPSATVTGGTAAVQGTLNLNGPAPAGFSINLLSDNTGVAAPTMSTVPVTAGASTANFQVQTSAVAQPASVTIAAENSSGNGSSAVLTVQPPVLTALSLSPSALYGGAPSTATFTLSGPAPASGLNELVLSSNNTGAASVPARITIAAGQTQGTFQITTFPVAPKTGVAGAPDTLVNIGASLSNASWNGGSRTGALTVRTPQLLNLLFNPTTVPTSTGSRETRLTVFLTSRAPAGGVTIPISYANGTSSPNKSLVPVPTSITVPAGQSTWPITVTCGKPKKQTSVTVSSPYLGVTRTTTITVNP